MGYFFLLVKILIYIIDSDLYNMFEEYTKLPIVKTKNSRVRISPMQFARGPRPTFYYSEDHFTVKTD